MKLEDADYHEIVAIECYGYVLNNPHAVKILIDNQVPHKTIRRGVAKIMAAADVGAHWIKLANAPNLDIKHD